MWVFGYGSLMWDHWEDRFQCQRRAPANLKGYGRTFNKASVKNWGTRANPGPTLNLSASANAACRGIAFSFNEVRRAAVLSYLSEREGGFELRLLPITIENGEQVEAIVPIYSTGKNLIEGRTVDELITMVRRARGTSGKCSDYVLNVAAHLAEAGIVDMVVTEFADSLKAEGTASTRKPS